MREYFLKIKINGYTEILNIKGLKNLDKAIVVQAYRDLKHPPNRKVWAHAILYLFLKETPEDLNDPMTFASLCARNNINPDSLAKIIWNKLRPEEQKRLLTFFLKEIKVSLKSYLFNPT